MSRFLAALVVIAGLLFAAAYFGSPAYTLYQLKQAAETHDSERLASLVDFPAVRENLKGQVDSQVTRAARTVGGIGWGPAAAIGKLGAAWGDRKIKKLVTPDSLARLLDTGHVSVGHIEVTSGDAPAGAHVKLHPTFAYMTLDSVRVRLKTDRGDVLPVALVMDRRGLFGWKVVRIDLAV